MTEDERKAAKARYMREYSKRSNNGPCSVDGCARSSYGRSGLCAMHYQRRRLLGDVGEAEPRFMQGFTVRERWEANVNKNGPLPTWAPFLGPCWLWTGGRFGGGYGMLGVEGKSRGAHCVGYELLVGPIPDGLELDHLCRVRHCVRPDHLEPVTQAENGRRGFSIQAQNARKIKCLRGHDLTDPSNLVPNSRGARQCRACVHIHRRERYLRTGK